MLALDHIIIATPDAKKTAYEFGNNNRVTIVRGGKHEEWGTQNYLAYFSNDCYIEWISVFNKKKAFASENPLVQQVVEALETDSEKTIQCAFRTDNIAAYTENLQELGIHYTGPVDGSRTKSDGELLEWKMLFPLAKTKDLLPFLIEWGTVKNLPENDILINQREIASLSLHIDQVETFSNIYKLKIENGQIKLVNITCTVQADEQLQFTIS